MPQPQHRPLTITIQSGSQIEAKTVKAEGVGILWPNLTDDEIVETIGEAIKGTVTADVKTILEHFAEEYIQDAS